MKCNRNDLPACETVHTSPVNRMYVHAAKKGHRIVNVDVEGVFAGAEERGSGVGERRESSDLGVVATSERRQSKPSPSLDAGTEEGEGGKGQESPSSSDSKNIPCVPICMYELRRLHELMTDSTFMYVILKIKKCVILILPVVVLSLVSCTFIYNNYNNYKKL